MSHRIFLVEDHPVMLRAYAQLFAREPDLTLCGCAESAERALDLLATVSCDLVLTDLALPGMDGIALVERLREAHPRLPVLVLSAHEDDLFVRRAEAAGAKGYIRKREINTDLLPTIRRILGGGPGSPAAPSE
jgi:DNA-binding NarL/FixJ family response regulator